jgi:YidC/Oxa1 family membrane protein insertase
MDITYQAMIPVLLWIHKLTHSYGLSIICLTLLVRAIVWPLVAASTKNMKRMQLLQPKMKAIQARYKDDPELLQKKVMEFYSRNKVNPVSGCLPMLIQLPLLFALFGTFNGPPFGDKAIDVKVTVVEAAEASKAHRNETSGSNSPYVSTDGKVAKLIVFPGESTVVEGQKIDFATRVVDGEVPADFKVHWDIRKGNAIAPPAEASIDQDGHAVFGKKGEYRVEGIVEGVAKNATFGPITSLGKKPTGIELLKPQNFDQVFLIILFGVSMYLSSKISMAGQTKPEEMDENQRIQADSMKYLPLIMTVSFCVMPLPTGVFLYMVVSNAVQTLQTWLMMKGPAEPLIDPDDEVGTTTIDFNPSDKSGGTIGSANAAANDKSNGKSDGNKIKFDQADLSGEGTKRKTTKKKKK